VVEVGVKHPTFRFKPKGTKWIRCEFEVGFDCHHEPALSSDPELRITGFNALGFIISHEYEIEGSYIVEVIDEAGDPLPSCAYPRRYRFTLSYRLHDKFGVGFNLGAGTGTFGHRSDSYLGMEKFQTDSICCDENGSSMSSTRRPYSFGWDVGAQLGLLTSALVLFGLAANYHMLDDEQDRSIYLVVLAALAAVAGFAGLWRRRMLRRGALEEKAGGPLPL
jgi:hypothetical protein